ASRSEDLQVEHPVWCGDASAFHFHATRAGMLSPTLIADQVIEPKKRGFVGFRTRHRSPWSRPPTAQCKVEGLPACTLCRRGKSHSKGSVQRKSTPKTRATSL